MALRALLHVASGDYSTLKADKESCELMVDGLQTLFRRFGDRRDYESSHAMYGSGDAYSSRKTLWCGRKRWSSCSAACCAPSSHYDSGATPFEQRLAEVLAQMKARAATASAAQLLELASTGLDLPAATRRTFVKRAHADSVLRTLGAFMDFAQRQGDAKRAAFLEELRRRQVATRGKPTARGGAGKALALATCAVGKGREWQQVLLRIWKEGQFPRATRNGDEYAEEAALPVCGDQPSYRRADPDSEPAARRTAAACSAATSIDKAQQAFQRMLDGPAGAPPGGRRRIPGVRCARYRHGPAETHGADRLAVHAPVGPAMPVTDTATWALAGCRRAPCAMTAATFFADGAELRHHGGRHVQHLGLGGIRVAREAAIEPAGGAGNVRNRGGDAATGAGFRGCQ